jgi:predicted transcriptional regulator/KaiC/GvpD/RAD55 family RecA-like ATPase
VHSYSPQLRLRNQHLIIVEIRRGHQLSSQRKRTKYDIYADVIEVIVKKDLSSLTRISYGANMPVDRAKKIVNFLVSHGFIREITVDDRKQYRTTKWGLEYLETFNRMQKFFAALEEPITISVPEVVLPGRITTGYKDLDNMLFGGIPENYAVALTSPSCDEKDLLIKRFLEAGAKEGQITFYVTTEAGGIKALVEEFQSNFYLFICNPQADAMIKTLPNTFKLKGVENLTDISIALTSASRKLDGSPKRPRRACIEIVSDVLLQHHAVQTRRWLTGLIPELKSKGFTTLAVINPQMHPSEEVQAVLDLFEGEINIYEKELETRSEKFLKIKKMSNQRYLENELPLRKERLET